MTTKIVRGQLLVFISSPKDYLGNTVEPETVRLHLNYIHADETVASNDPEIDMDMQTDGSFRAEFDTKDVEPGALFVSIRTTGPASAWDSKYQITANQANPKDTASA